MPTVPTVAEAFALNGARNTIPIASQINITPGAASYNDGFPPDTMIPPTAGGIPPNGLDFNGILYAISGPVAAMSQGQGFQYSSAYANLIGGYKPGAMLAATDATGYWFNITNNNSTNPDSGGAGWIPAFNYGLTQVSGLTNANVTLTAAQYRKQIIQFAGTLTGNVQMIFPTIQGMTWLVSNNCSGNFSLTVKTSGGSGVIVPSSYGAQTSMWVYCDGTNLFTGAPPQNAVVLLNPAGNAAQTISGNLTVSTILNINGAGAYLGIKNTSSSANNGQWIFQSASNFLTIAAYADNLGTATPAITAYRVGASVATVTLGGSAQYGTTQVPLDNSLKLATTAYTDSAVAVAQSAVGSIVVAYQPTGVAGITTGFTAIIGNTALVPGGVYEMFCSVPITYNSSTSNTLKSQVIVSPGSGAVVSTIGSGVNICCEGPTTGSNSNVVYGNAANMTGMSIFNSTTQELQLYGRFTMPNTAVSITWELAVTTGTLAVLGGCYARFLRVA